MIKRGPEDFSLGEEKPHTRGAWSPGLGALPSIPACLSLLRAGPRRRAHRRVCRGRHVDDAAGAAEPEPGAHAQLRRQRQGRQPLHAPGPVPGGAGAAVGFGSWQRLGRLGLAGGDTVARGPSCLSFSKGSLTSRPVAPTPRPMGKRREEGLAWAAARCRPCAPTPAHPHPHTAARASTGALSMWARGLGRGDAWTGHRRQAWECGSGWKGWGL